MNIFKKTLHGIVRVSILEKNDQAGKQNQELTSRKKQALRTRQKIFKKTMELGTQKGFAALKITDVCKAANISVGTFYHYFHIAGCGLSRTVHRIR